MKEVVPDRAAHKSGRIQPGDEIVAIDGRATKVLLLCERLYLPARVQSQVAARIHEQMRFPLCNTTLDS